MTTKEMIATPYHELDTLQRKQMLFLISELLLKDKTFDEYIREAIHHAIKLNVLPSRIMEFREFTEEERLDILKPIEKPQEQFEGGAPYNVKP